MNGAEVDRLRWINLQLLPQLHDVVINRSSRWIGSIVPYIIQQFLSRDDPFRMLNKVLQQLDLMCGEKNGTPSLKTSMPEKSAVTLPKLTCVLVAGFLCSANCRLDPSHQLSRAERLGHIVVCAQLEQQHFICHLRDCT